jgi:hypothetical protein
LCAGIETVHFNPSAANSMRTAPSSELAII